MKPKEVMDTLKGIEKRHPLNTGVFARYENWWEDYANAFESLRGREEEMYVPLGDMRNEPSILYRLNLVEQSVAGIMGLQPFSSGTLFLIQHLKENFPPYLKLFEALGARKDRIFIIGIPYSNNMNCLLWLQENDYKFWVPGLSVMEKVVQEALEEATREHMPGGVLAGQPFVVVDDGGHTTSYFLKTRKNALLRGGGVVEQTARGIKRVRSILGRESPSYPIIDVATSDLKSILESPYIGESIIFSTEEILREHIHDGIAMRLAVVVGLGNIGLSVAKSLRSRKGYVLGADPAEMKRLGAHVEGIIAFPKLADVFDVLKLDGRSGTTPNLIVCATGQESFPAELFGRLYVPQGHTLTLVCGSSKDIEFDWQNGLPPIIDSGHTVYRLPNNGRRFRLNAEHGGGELLLFPTPVNFGFGSVPARIFQPIQAALMLSAADIVIRANTLEPGIQHPSADIQEPIARLVNEDALVASGLVPICPSDSTEHSIPGLHPARGETRGVAGVPIPSEYATKTIPPSLERKIQREFYDSHLKLLKRLSKYIRDVPFDYPETSGFESIGPSIAGKALLILLEYLVSTVGGLSWPPKKFLVLGGSDWLDHIQSAAGSLKDSIMHPSRDEWGNLPAKAFDLVLLEDIEQSEGMPPLPGILSSEAAVVNLARRDCTEEILALFLHDHSIERRDWLPGGGSRLVLKSGSSRKLMILFPVRPSLKDD